MSLFGRFLVIVGLKNDPERDPAGRARAEEFREKLNVYRVEKSRVIVIEMSSEDPELAAEDPEHHRRRLSGRPARRQAAVERRRDRLAGARDRRPVASG